MCRVARCGPRIHRHWITGYPARVKPEGHWHAVSVSKFCPNCRSDGSGFLVCVFQGCPCWCEVVVLSFVDRALLSSWRCCFLPRVSLKSLESVRRTFYWIGVFGLQIDVAAMAHRFSVGSFSFRVVFFAFQSAVVICCARLLFLNCGLSLVSCCS